MPCCCDLVVAFRASCFVFGSVPVHLRCVPTLRPGLSDGLPSDECYNFTSRSGLYTSLLGIVAVVVLLFCCRSTAQPYSEQGRLWVKSELGRIDSINLLAPSIAPVLTATDERAEVHSQPTYTYRSFQTHSLNRRGRTTLNL
jgi:hypothetical protein